MANLRRVLSQSQHPIAGAAKRAYRGLREFTLPAPKAVVLPALWAFLGLRAVYYYAARVFVCEPLFKAYCKSYGRGVRTGVFVHYVQGAGDLVLGDRVLVDGRCSIGFASRFSDRPTLILGDRTEVGHGCSFTVGKRIKVGRDVRISLHCVLSDSNGHPLEADARRANLPPRPREVRPIEIGDDAWIGQRSIILPGARIGEGAIVSAGSVVRGRVEPYTLVGGNPAVVLAALPRPAVVGRPTAQEPSSSERSDDVDVQERPVAAD